MSLRTRLALLILAAVTFFVGVGMVTTSWLARSSLIAAVDDLLEPRSVNFRDVETPPRGTLPGRITEAVLDSANGEGGESDVRFQILDADGSLLFGAPEIPIDAATIAAAQTGETLFRTLDIDDREFRVMTIARDDGTVFQAATSIESIIAGLATLRVGMFLIGLASIMFAGLAGWFLAGRFIRPITEVAEATSLLATDDVLPDPIATTRGDEIGDLVLSFNALIAALHASRDNQERLVADASHELRTPLTSLRMKIDFLHREPDLDPATRVGVVQGATEELESLTELVTELVTLARHDLPDDPVTDVALGDLVDEVASRARVTTGRTIVVDRDDHDLPLRAARVRRAVSNLVDNAHKYSPADESIEIVQAGGSVTVRDHGSGIDAETQRRAFDRFYRAPSAQPTPGSGIGLAIVQRVAHDHGGRAWLDNAPDGGTIAVLELTSEATPQP